ncbi:Tethering factor for nuclear proteasome sts1 [Podochytrium sp. JEL0797]|nr:Tethering factor for nuclear proteasome sts1 [Podochytrium sp. JEL0797]
MSNNPHSVSWAMGPAVVNSAAASFGSMRVVEAAAAAAAPGDAGAGSSRKRKAARDGDGSDGEGEGDSSSNSNALPATPTRVTRSVLPAKRLRLVWDGDDAPSSSSSHSSPRAQDKTPSSSTRTLPLARILDTLDKPALLALLKDLVKSDPPLAARAAALLPRPTIASAERHLKQAIDALDDAFPYAAPLGRDRSSDYAANRVKTQMRNALEILSLYLTHFTEPCSYPPHLMHEYPSESFHFLHLISSQILPRLPHFQNPLRNQDRFGSHEAYRLVARAWRVAIAESNRRVREEGRMFPAQTCGGWLRDLMAISQALDGQGKFGFQEAVEEFMRGEIGWIAVESGGAGGGASFQDMQMFQQHQQQALQQQQHQLQHQQQGTAAAADGSQFSFV